MSAQAAPNTLCFIESVIVARRHFLLGHQQASASQMKAVASWACRAIYLSVRFTHLHTR